VEQGTPTHLIRQFKSKLTRFSGPALALLMIAVMALTGCSTDGDPTPYDRNDFTPIAGPPRFPMIFEGEFTVDGEPGPAGLTIYAEFIHGGSPLSTTIDGGYVQVILGPVSEADLEYGVINFYLGDREGDRVKAEENWEWKGVAQPTTQVLDLTFPRLPKN
jgi:hypothetical protein